MKCTVNPEQQLIQRLDAVFAAVIGLITWHTVCVCPWVYNVGNNGSTDTTVYILWLIQQRCVAVWFLLRDRVIGTTREIHAYVWLHLTYGLNIILLLLQFLCDAFKCSVKLHQIVFIVRKAQRKKLFLKLSAHKNKVVFVCISVNSQLSVQIKT